MTRLDGWIAQREWDEAAFAASGRRDWVEGFMLWDWPARLYDESEAAANDDYCLYGKQAERTVREHYASKVRAAGS